MLAIKRIGTAAAMLSAYAALAFGVLVSASSSTNAAHGLNSAYYMLDEHPSHGSRWVNSFQTKLYLEDWYACGMQQCWSNINELYLYANIQSPNSSSFSSWGFNGHGLGSPHSGSQTIDSSSTPIHKYHYNLVSHTMGVGSEWELHAGVCQQNWCLTDLYFYRGAHIKIGFLPPDHWPKPWLTWILH